MWMISPYKHEDQWVFDDNKVSLVKEAFVSGADRLIDAATAHIQNADKGFALYFSDQPFEGYTTKLYWVRPEDDNKGGGDYYYSPQYDIEAWLCPSLGLYFATPPKDLYILCKPLTPTN